MTPTRQARAAQGLCVLAGLFLILIGVTALWGWAVAAIATGVVMLIVAILIIVGESPL